MLNANLSLPVPLAYHPEAPNPAAAFAMLSFPIFFPESKPSRLSARQMDSDKSDMNVCG